MVYVTHVHMESSGNGHEHIANVKWRDPSDGGTGASTRAQMVEWIEGGGIAKVTDGTNTVGVGVVEPAYGPKYIRTFADGTWTDNLLSLPRF